MTEAEREARFQVHARRQAIVAAVVLPLVLVISWAYRPTESSWYPRCMLYRYTGIHCAGCGAARALHLLLHGDLRHAVAENVLLVAMVPVLLVGVVNWYRTALFKRPVSHRPIPVWLVVVFIGVVVAYTVARNLPWYPFTLLAPTLLPD
jgi:Protein of unknown function (DUF2752)